MNALDQDIGDFEFLTIQALPESRDQAVISDWIQGIEPIPAKRKNQAYGVDNFVQTIIPDDESWIYVGPGQNLSGSANQGANRFQSGLILPTGQVASWLTASNQNSSRWGYGGVAVSSQAFLLGGTSSGIEASRRSGTILLNGGISNLNSIPGDLQGGPRELMGSALGSGRIFLIGGNTPTGITKTIESMVW